MTLAAALASATRILDERRVPSPRLTAEVMLAHAMGVERAHLYAHDDEALPGALAAEFDRMVARRAGGEPLQYITGLQEFYGRRFEVGPSVLIPRPETEFVIDAVLAANRWGAPSILDVGTGSGAIAVTLALELPRARVFASDVSVEAIHLARRNAGRLGARVEFACADLLDAWAGPFQIVASNPPYVSRGEEAHLQREVRDHEPHIALFADGDALDFYRRLGAGARKRLVRDGALVVEIGYSREAAVRELLEPDWEIEPTRHDLQGIPRVVTARASGV